MMSRRANCPCHGLVRAEPLLVRLTRHELTRPIRLDVGHARSALAAKGLHVDDLQWLADQLAVKDSHHLPVDPIMYDGRSCTGGRMLAGLRDGPLRTLMLLIGAPIIVLVMLLPFMIFWGLAALCVLPLVTLRLLDSPLGAELRTVMAVDVLHGCIREVRH